MLGCAGSPGVGGLLAAPGPKLCTPTHAPCAPPPPSPRTRRLCRPSRACQGSRWPSQPSLGSRSKATPPPWHSTALPSTVGRPARGPSSALASNKSTSTTSTARWEGSAQHPSFFPAGMLSTGEGWAELGWAGGGRGGGLVCVCGGGGSNCEAASVTTRGQPPTVRWDMVGSVCLNRAQVSG